MGSSVRRWLIALGVGFLILFTLFVVNQIAQLAALAERVSPALGQFTLWTLVALCALCLFVPLYLVLRLPRTLVPPVSETDPGFPCYLQQLRQRLRRNPHLHQPELDTREQIEAALAELGEKADEVTRQTALQVLVSTAVLQNGSLDALAVLVAQSRMVYRIATIYYQRPGLLELVRLYSNVAACTFLARQLEDIDLAEFVQPLISVGLTSAVGSAVPGTARVVSLATESLLQGSANAFLTLRVGVIAKGYCGSVVLPSRPAVIRSATLQATKMIPSLVREASKQVGSALAKALRGRVVEGGAGVVRKVSEAIKGASGEVSRGASQAAAGVWSKVRRGRKQQYKVDRKQDEGQ